MLKAVVALLLVANLAFFAWSRGWLEPVMGWAPQSERDPARLKRQVHPEVVKVLPAAAEPASGPAAAAATACLEAGPFSEADANGAEQALRNAGIAPQRWQTVTVDRAGVWAVYMGRFPDAEAMKHKEAELQRIHVGFDEVHQPAALEPGLVLGRFPDKAGADEALAKLSGRGVRTARVVELAPPSQALLLRLEALDAAQADVVRGLKGTAGAAPLFRPCAPA
jgi:hypothetical protein